GGIVTAILVPDRQGHFEDVVLGYEDAESYIKNNGPYMGAIIGRYANRIAKGMFTLDGQTFKLATNNGPNHLHGGNKGFDKVVWRAEEFRTADSTGITFAYTSPNAEEGYPGQVTARVRYTVTHKNELIIDYSATSDAPP